MGYDLAPPIKHISFCIVKVGHNILPLLLRSVDMISMEAVNLGFDECVVQDRGV